MVGIREFKLGIFLGDGSPLAGFGVSPRGVRLDWQEEVVLPQQVFYIPPGVALPSKGSSSLGWEKAVATVAAVSSLKTMRILDPLCFFSGRGKCVRVFENIILGVWKLPGLYQ